MSIFLGADHRGFKLKEAIKKHLRKLNYRFEDLGNFKFDPKDDYPDFAFAVAKKVSQKRGKGILICGSGEGMCLVANKVKGIRAATAFNPSQAKNLREKNDINILCLASDWIEEKEAKKIVEVFLKIKFSKLPRHKRRIEKIKKLENYN